MAMTRVSARIALVAVALALPAGGRAAEPANRPAPDIHGETIGQVAERTGYSVKEIVETFPPIARWGELGVKPDPRTIADTFARERFSPPPKVGVHPRVWFSPSDLPDLRRRLTKTHVGRLAMAAIRGRLLQISPRKADWESVPHKPKTGDYAAFARRGLHIEPRMGYRGPWLGGFTDELVAGRVPQELDKIWSDPPARSIQRYLMHLLPYEAFRCLIDNDTAGGKRVAAALVTIAGRYEKDMARWQATRDWQRVYQLIGSQSMGQTYDWAWPFMTDAQRSVVRRCIAGITKGKRFLGQDQLPAFPGNTSNWNIIHANLVPMILSIEGEEGYDHDVYLRLVAGLRKWVYVASGPDGAPFEGLFKSRYAPHWLIPLAKRGELALGSVWSRNFIRTFHLHTMLPWGGEHVFETGISRARDVAGFKYAHPTDPVIDLIYTAHVRDRFAAGARGTWPNIRTSYPPLWHALVTVDDPLGADKKAYDPRAAFERGLARLAKTEPVTYFSDYRGLLVTRTAWTPDAAMLYFEPRHVHGGHTRASRGEFVFAADGRVWAQRTVAVESSSNVHSVLIIDGKGQGPFRCLPGKTVCLSDTKAATFAAADLTVPYSRVTCDPNHKDAQPIPLTPNDSRLTPGKLPWMARPWSFLPTWHTGAKPVVDGKPNYRGRQHHHWIPYNPVKYVFRTAGLVRGKHPYALIVDDARKGDAAAEYVWQMQVPDDVKAAEGESATPGDLILAEAGGPRRLLVRLLAEEGKAPAVKLAPYETTRRGKTSKRLRVEIRRRAVTARFAVLLYPCRKGGVVPLTPFDPGAGRLTIRLPGQVDAVTVTPGRDGRTRLAWSRTGAASAGTK